MIPDPAAMTVFCNEMLPKILRDVCSVPPEAADEVGQDVLRRASAIAQEPTAVQETLAAPFVEEVIDHAPPHSPEFLKAITTLVVRNSRLEDWHVCGLVNDGGIEAITTAAVAPLSHLLASQRDQQRRTVDTEFSGLPSRYPRAWACLTHLFDALTQGGGRVSYRPPQAAIPELPTDDEIVEARAVASVEAPAGSSAVVLNGIDPRFDSEAVRLLRAASEGEGMLVAVSTLSRFSRNQEKLMRTLEILLAHRAEVITSNSLLRNGEVHIRLGAYIKPDSRRPLDALRNQVGFNGVHRKVVQRYLSLLDAVSP